MSLAMAPSFIFVSPRPATVSATYYDKSGADMQGFSVSLEGHSLVAAATSVVATHGQQRQDATERVPPLLRAAGRKKEAPGRASPGP